MSRQQSLVIEFDTAVATPSSGETLAVCVFADDPHLPDRARLGESLRRLVGEALDEGAFKGEESDSFLLHSVEGGSAARVLLIGAGRRAEFDAETLKRSAGLAARRARHARGGTLRFLLPGGFEEARAHARAATEGALFGLYENEFYRKKEDDEPYLKRLIIVAPNDDENLAAEIERGRIVAESVNWARSLADEPGLSLPPREFARRAAEMAAEFGLEVETLDAEEIRAKGMGALLGVAQGSEEEPALIVLRYEPESSAGANPQANDEGELWAFVGKGITFDTGGISIKHGLDMYEMKADMAGGAAVLGAMRAVAQLKPARRIVAVVPATENMPSGKAIKPGDIVRTLAGHTIEVVDTDAEGRLVLVDGIAYARNLGATRIVDLATLTGSIIIALGDHRAGLFSNDDDWAGRVTEAAERAGEPVWRMPVSDDYKKRIESMIADFKNYGGRPDATAAALLLSKFAGDTPWVHLDIAGTSWLDSPRPDAPKGSTGAGTRTLIELACARDGKD